MCATLNAAFAGLTPALDLVEGKATPSPEELVALAFLERYRNATRIAYQASLKAWAARCVGFGIPTLSADSTHLERWLHELEERGSAPATRARHMAALSGFYEEAVSRGACAHNPLAGVRHPKVGADSPRLGPDRAQARAFLDASAREGYHAHLLACLLVLNGLRISEALALTVADVAEEHGHQVVKVVRKGGQRATVPLAQRTAAVLQCCLAGWDSTEDSKDDPLIVDSNGWGWGLSRFQAYRLVRHIARAARIPGRITPDSLRHTFVTLSLDAGVPLRDVQDSAGHADPRTTRRYDRARYSLGHHATHSLARYLG